MKAVVINVRCCKTACRGERCDLGDDPKVTASRGIEARRGAGSRRRKNQATVGTAAAHAISKATKDSHAISDEKLDNERDSASIVPSVQSAHEAAVCHD